MTRKIAIAAATAALAVPAAAPAVNPGQEKASPCGASHGMFRLPAHGTLTPAVPDFARAGEYKHGTVGDRASNPACHTRPG